MSWKSDLRDGIVESTLNETKRLVRIQCTDKETGKSVASIISGHIKELAGGYTHKNIRQGFGYKDFRVVFNVRDGAKIFYDNLEAILSATDDEYSDDDLEDVEDIEDPEVVPTSTGVVSEDNTGLYLGIGAAVLVVVLLFFYFKK